MNLETPPRWARSWCYYFMLGAFASALAAVGTLLVLATSYSEVAKSTGGVVKVGVYLLVLVVQALTSATLFWMCRASLPR